MGIMDNLFFYGSSQADVRGLFPSLARFLGRRLALLHRNVSIDRSSMVSPTALISARAGKIRIGSRCMINTGAMIQGEVELGNDVSVQNYSILVGYPNGGAIQIGNDVRIAAHSLLVAANHCFGDRTRPIREQGLNVAPIVIENDVWIGANVFIGAGVTIGHGSVIGAGSVVIRDIPPWSVAVGNPAHVIKTREFVSHLQ